MDWLPDELLLHVCDYLPLVDKWIYLKETQYSEDRLSNIIVTSIRDYLSRTVFKPFLVYLATCQTFPYIECYPWYLQVINKCITQTHYLQNVKLTAKSIIVEHMYMSLVELNSISDRASLYPFTNANRPRPECHYFNVFYNNTEILDFVIFYATNCIDPHTNLMCYYFNNIRPYVTIKRVINWMETNMVPRRFRKVHRCNPKSIRFIGYYTRIISEFERFGRLHLNEFNRFIRQKLYDDHVRVLNIAVNALKNK